MTEESRREKLEAERKLVEQAGGSDPKWKGWMLTILFVEIVYIIMEFSFNAALLNVASGVFPDPETLDKIELAGRILSGVGFGLLLYGLFGMRYRNRICWENRQAMMLLGIMPVAILVMYAAQEVLIENLIVEKASDEDRFAATYLSLVRPAIRNGSLILEDVPITEETSDRPENKAFLAIAGMLMASNNEVVDRIPREIDNIVAALVHREALESQDALYKAYTEIDQELTAFYRNYVEGQKQLPHRINQIMGDMGNSGFYRELDSDFDQAYANYASGAKAIYEAIGKKAYFKPYYVASACNSRRQPYLQSTCDAVYRKNSQIYYERTGSKLDVLKFCDLRRMGHQQCDWSAERVGRIVYADMTAEKRRTSPISLTVRGIPLGLSKRQFYKHDGFARLFGSRSHNGVTLRARDLVFNSAGIPDAKASVRKAITNSVYNEFAYEINRVINTGHNDIDTGMSRNQFYRTATIQESYGAIFGEDSEPVFIKPGLSASQFLEQVLLPKSWKTAEARLEGIPRSIAEMKRDDDMKERAENAVRAMVVPPIALVFSLFFSLFTLSKVFHHIAAIQYIKKPGTFPLRKVKLAITSSFLLIVISFPYFLTANPMVKTGIVDAASGNGTSSKPPSTMVVLAMDWMIRAEPAIYPFGNAMIGLPLMPFGKWHDADAQDVGSEDMEKLTNLNLVTAMSVTDVQRRLKAMGYQVGSVDGLMGRNTMNALKAFQRSQGLAVTGAIDAATTMALRKR